MRLPAHAYPELLCPSPPPLFPGDHDISHGNRGSKHAAVERDPKAICPRSVTPDIKEIRSEARVTSRTGLPKLPPSIRCPSTPTEKSPLMELAPEWSPFRFET